VPALDGFAAGCKLAFVIVKFLATGPMLTSWNVTRAPPVQKIPSFFLIQIKVDGKKSRWPVTNAREATP
jgi:hypothetical protein